jgi:hypothetical protein
MLEGSIIDTKFCDSFNNRWINIVISWYRQGMIPRHLWFPRSEDVQVTLHKTYSVCMQPMHTPLYTLNHL